MSILKLTALGVFLALGVFPASAKAQVPRKSPDLMIVEPAGKQTRLSSLRGKVVLVEFFLTNCPRCQRVEGTIAKLYKELGSRGFQAIGIAFDQGINGPIVTELVQRLGITYPVGYASSDKVDSYLGRQPMERFRVPQVVVIDRKGVIRAQSRPTDEKNLEDENYLRNMIDSLLKERAPARSKPLVRIQSSRPTRKGFSHDKRGKPFSIANSLGDLLSFNEIAMVSDC